MGGRSVQHPVGRRVTDPLSPTPLSERERRLVSDARELAPSNPDYPIPWDRYLLSRLVAIIDRLSAAPVDDRERVPEGWRVKWRPFICGWCRSSHDQGEVPTLVPVSPSVDPEEKP